MSGTIPTQLPYPHDIDYILFDLGGVLLDIDYDASVRAFRHSGFENFDALYSQAKQSEVFDEFECGHMSPSDFRDWVKSHAEHLSIAQIDQAWNSMLIGLPEARLSWLEGISKRYPLFLLSNTNEIHIQAFEAQIEEELGLKRFQDCFQGYHYSSRIGRRKPDPDTFLWVMNQHDIEPAKCLFIDDSPQHVSGALEAGLKAVYLEPGRPVEDLFDDDWI